MSQQPTDDIILRTDEKNKREAIEYARTLVGFPPGREFIKHLFRIGGVGTLPDEGLVPEFLRAELGRLKLAREIYQLVAEAEPEKAALLLAEVEKERRDAQV